MDEVWVLVEGLRLGLGDGVEKSMDEVWFG